MDRRRSALDELTLIGGGAGVNTVLPARVTNPAAEIGLIVATGPIVSPPADRHGAAKVPPHLAVH